MTDTGRAKSTRRKRGGSQAIFAAVVLLGVIASIILLLTDSVQWLRLGIVTSLWAAVVGAFAMTKYRRDSAADQTKARDLQMVYELQLEREIAARREYELGVEARVRGEIGADVGELRALRAELAGLRRNLQMLFDGELPEDRSAITAEAMRMRELADRSYSGYQPAPSGLYVPGRVGSDGRARTDVEPEPGYSSNAPFATPHDEPVTAETSIINGEFDTDGAFHPAPQRDSLSQVPETVDEPLYTDPGFDRNAYGSAPLDESPFEQPAFDESPGFESPGFESPGFESPGFESPGFESHSYDIPPFEPATRAAYVPEPEEEPVAEVPVAEVPVAEVPVAEVPVAEVPVAEPRRSHRRSADEDDDDLAAGGAHSSGRSVADILAGMQSGGGTSSDSQSGRRRRRVE